MINWFIILIIVVVVFVLAKVGHLKHTRHKLVLVIVILLLAFFVSSLYFVSKANNIDITTLNGLSSGMQVYSGWLLNSFQNIASITGYTIGLDWNSENKTISLNNSIVTGTKEIGNKVVETGSDVVDKVKANTPKLITNYR